MYVCLCRGVTDKQIKQELEGKGPGNFREVCSKLGVGMDCGTCTIATEQLLEQVLAAKKNSTQGSFKI
jgi:bacterioferritin-associated ferredoxin